MKYTVPGFIIKEETPVTFFTNRSTCRMCADNKPIIRLIHKEETCLEEGIQLITMNYEREDGSPFWAYAVVAAPSKACLITGTANGGYGTIDCTAFVPEHMESARKEGHDVIADLVGKLGIGKGSVMSPAHAVGKKAVQRDHNTGLAVALLNHVVNEKLR